MEITEIDRQEKIESQPFPENSSWNGRKISSFERRREKELCKLKTARPLKKNDPQGYYTYRAREEQIRYELDLRNSGAEFLHGHFYDSLTLYGHALNHLKRRGEYEERLYAVWLQRVRAQDFPPTPDILFINQGISQTRLV